MRRGLIALFVVVAAVFGTASLFSPADAAGGGFGSCTYRCICSVPNRCCTVNGVTTCTPDPNGPLQCTQQYDC